MYFDFATKDRSFRAGVDIVEGVVAGWAGRDRAGIEAHIVELEALGVPRPSTVPLFYRVSGQQFTTAGSIEVVGDDTSGEVEACLVRHGGQFWVGVASDHTDRKLETVSVAKSKQVCAKPISQSLWLLDDVLPQWDQLIARSYILDGDSPELYQEGPLAQLLAPLELVDRYLGETARSGVADGFAMLCGTQPVHGGIRGAAKFRIELEDPKLGRSLTHEYSTSELPVVS